MTLSFTQSPLNLVVYSHPAVDVMEVCRQLQSSHPVFSLLLEKDHLRKSRTSVDSRLLLLEFESLGLAVALNQVDLSLLFFEDKDGCLLLTTLVSSN